jgi:D-3-phosphoglycerate dehydrogenase
LSNQILITTRKFHGYDTFAREFLKQRGFELIEHQRMYNIRRMHDIRLHREMDDATLLRIVPPAAGLIAGPERVSDVVMAAAPDLRVVNAPGVGYDHIDVEAATRRGIVVCTNPGCNHHAVAEMTLGMMLCLARKICLADRQMRAGQWQTMRGIELRGKTLGIVGLGRIGKSLAVSARGMGMQVWASDKVQDEAFAWQHGIRYVPLEELIPAADFLSLHCPLTSETRGLIDAEALERMKPTAYLVNTARGPLVDEAALIEALRTGKIAGAGIDVYDTEPLVENPYTGLDNVVQTPHCAGHSLEAIQCSLEMALENITRVLRGQEPLHRIN